jgi:hypothetical protein
MRFAIHSGTIAAMLLIIGASASWGQAAMRWPVHSMDRPEPPVVDPGPAVESARPPSDAIVLFDGSGLSEWRDSRGGPARVTVLHNGVLVQDNVTLTGPSSHKARPPYKAHPDRLPLALQDHGDPVRFRNIWVRELTEGDR